MPPIDREAPLRFLRTAFQPDDWIAIFLKSYETGQVTQRVGPLEWVMHPRFQAWLRFKNFRKYNVYCSVNAIAPWKRTRTRDSVRAIRHVFLEADHDGPAVLSRIAARPDLPDPSYVLHSSPDRVHVFWRVTRFQPDYVEALQRRLARELDTDPAATPATQTTRLAGYSNHKYRPAHVVTIDYGCTDSVYTPSDFPAVGIAIRASTASTASSTATPALRNGQQPRRLDAVERARRYLARVPPAMPASMATCTLFGCAVALCGASGSRMTKPFGSCLTGTVAVSRLGLTVISETSSIAPGGMVANLWGASYSPQLPQTGTRATDCSPT